MNNAVAITIAPVNDGENDYLLLGFNSPWFSQSVNLPYNGIEAAREFGEQITEALVKSAEEIAKTRLMG